MRPASEEEKVRDSVSINLEEYSRTERKFLKEV